MNRKKVYEKPSLEVVKLQVQNQLLAGSGGLDGPGSYGGGDDPFAEDSEGGGLDGPSYYSSGADPFNY